MYLEQWNNLGGVLDYIDAAQFNIHCKVVSLSETRESMREKCSWLIYIKNGKYYLDNYVRKEGKINMIHIITKIRTRIFLDVLKYKRVRWIVTVVGM